MKDAILEIIGTVPKGCIFDSHFVINQLIKKYSDVYINFACNYSGKDVTTTTHAQIGQEIRRLGKDSLQHVGNSWSENIHGNISPCTCWEKL